MDFWSPTTASELNRFIDTQLQPSADFNCEMNQIVDDVCKFLKSHFGPREIVKVCI